MNYRLVSILALLIVFQTSFSVSFSQSSKLNSISGRYLIIDDFSTFFKESGENVTTENFQLYNITEDESSKPIFVAVSELSNVVKFSIEASSSTNENQRRCKLTIKKEEYLNTFRLVLFNMNVEFIVSDNIAVPINDFFDTIKL